MSFRVILLFVTLHKTAL